jgi:hypothetical protein
MEDLARRTLTQQGGTEWPAAFRPGKSRISRRLAATPSNRLCFSIEAGPHPERYQQIDFPM